MVSWRRTSDIGHVSVLRSFPSSFAKVLYREHRKARLISTPVHLISQPVVGQQCSLGSPGSRIMH
jgi:hypothetical protein